MKQKQWLEISSAVFEENIIKLRKITKNEILVVVKANAYGHGIKEVTKLAHDNNIRWFGVDNIDEALILRDMLGSDIKILILGYTPLDRLNEAVQNNISITIYNIETIKKIKNLDFSSLVNVHLKIESGMHRQGVLPEDIPSIVSELHQVQNIVVEGISTHFAEPEDILFTAKQIESFTSSINQLKEFGIAPRYIHSSASSAILYAENAPGNLVRAGRAVYGFIGDFLPILTWKSIVAQIKTIKSGQSVGYGHTWTAKKTSRIAIIPIGYSDGYDRKLSNCGRVLIQGEYADVVGRIAMNMFIVDVSSIENVKVEDEVVIIGKQGNNEILIGELAEKVNTISHEIVARINPNIYKIIK